MFTEGTFSRYLFEITATHERLKTLYRELAERAEDEEVRRTARTFLAELEDEAPIIEQLRTDLAPKAPPRGVASR